ncbi:MAG TPA: DUF4910 domain-containing protein [Saprospiraceae bacterium]|nr:DUF4910 domain-containing protein [Saprospiraceae bacterium]HMP23667.1 DUF4910 domain-containing protein [Saprospiraceae bacterium]
MEQKLEYYFNRLFPLNRSLTGDANRQTLNILSELVDLKIHEVPSGTECYDWVIPPEWNAMEAWIKDEDGNEVVNFRNHNLHLMGYSTPVDAWLDFEQLKTRIHTLPDHPDWIPYIASYYHRDWGFCMTHIQFLELNTQKKYHVYIDATLDERGSMTYADVVLPGRLDKEILFTTYICHPSMANNELSGPLVQSMLYRKIKAIPDRKFTYRFVFAPETIGTIYYLSQYGNYFKEKLAAGLVLTCIGDDGKFHYKCTRNGHTLTDRAMTTLLENEELSYNILPFVPMGSDERQYNSPGFQLPVGTFMRTPFGRYLEYHTSADNKAFISFEAMAESVEVLFSWVQLIERNEYYRNTLPYGEPMLGKRGLYPTKVSNAERSAQLKAMMWMLNLADGENDLIEILKRGNINTKVALEMITQLLSKKILTIHEKKV